MESVALRRCLPGDADRLSLVGQATFLESFAGTLTGDDILAHCSRQHSIEKYAGMLADSATATWLAEIESGRAPVGYVVLTKPDLPLPDLGPGDLEVKRIYLLRRFQGGGVGARLMQTAEAEARARQARRLLLGVYSGNDSAIAFYKKMGFVLAGERTFRVGNTDCRDFIFALTLA